MALLQLLLFAGIAWILPIVLIAPALGLLLAELRNLLIRKLHCLLGFIEHQRLGQRQIQPLPLKQLLQMLERQAGLARGEFHPGLRRRSRSRLRQLFRLPV